MPTRNPIRDTEEKSDVSHHVIDAWAVVRWDQLIMKMSRPTLLTGPSIATAPGAEPADDDEMAQLFPGAMRVADEEAARARAGLGQVYILSRAHDGNHPPIWIPVEFAPGALRGAVRLVHAIKRRVVTGDSSFEGSPPPPSAPSDTLPLNASRVEPHAQPAQALSGAAGVTE